MDAIEPPTQRGSQLALVFVFIYSLVEIKALVNNAHRNGSSGYDVRLIIFLLTSLTSGFLLYATWKGKGAIMSCELMTVILFTDTCYHPCQWLHLA